ncbi:MAG: hypothetical protein EA001_03025 [Oscillatoriales cyanobacterium]|nr:MAG: hypothetical protein EA001_03025 [Oscillatoriales cyanobacterium]
MNRSSLVPAADRWCLGLSLGAGTWSVALRDRQFDRVGLLGLRSPEGPQLALPWDWESPSTPLPKALFGAGLAYRPPGTTTAQPVVQWDGGRRSAPLPVLIETLGRSLARLRDPHLPWVTATGKPVPPVVLRSLSEVVVAYPVPSCEAWRSNLREAVLAAGLVARASQVSSVAEGLAAAIAWDGPRNWGCCGLLDQQGEILQLTLIDRDFGRQVAALHGLAAHNPVSPLDAIDPLDALNGAFNHLCSQSGIAPQKIERLLVRGAIAASSDLAQDHAPAAPDPISGLAQYLRQKCPNAIMTWEPPPPAPIALGRVAIGATHIPEQPPWDSAQPYDHYFLFAALLRHLGPEPQSLEQLLDRLEQDGIHARACRRSIQQLLEGTIPAGLLPDPTFAPGSATDPVYQALAAGAPFLRLTTGWYALEATAGTHWRRYLGRVWGRSFARDLEPTFDRT